jgi:hypothetical protein
MVNLQNKSVIVGTPIEIEQAVNHVRLMLAEIPWVSHPYHIAQRFVRKRENDSKNYIYPETYVGGGQRKYSYHRLTPDNDYVGMFFFMVGNEESDFKPNQNNFITQNVSIIFSVNLQLIDETKLEQGLFTQELIRDVRRKLTKNAMLFDFAYTIDSVTRDLNEVYREFTLKELEQYNRVPMQCFRFDMSFTLQEDCGETTLYSGESIPNDGECCSWSTDQF